MLLFLGVQPGCFMVSIQKWHLMACHQDTGIPVWKDMATGILTLSRRHGCIDHNMLRVLSWRTANLSLIPVSWEFVTWGLHFGWSWGCLTRFLWVHLCWVFLGIGNSTQKSCHQPNPFPYNEKQKPPFHHLQGVSKIKKIALLKTKVHTEHSRFHDKSLLTPNRGPPPRICTMWLISLVLNYWLNPQIRLGINVGVTTQSSIEEMVGHVDSCQIYCNYITLRLKTLHIYYTKRTVIYSNTTSKLQTPHSKYRTKIAL